MERCRCFFPEEASRCEHFMSIDEVIVAFRKEETEVLTSVSKIREMMEKLSGLEYRLPIFTHADAFGICLLNDVIVTREEVEIKRTVVVPPNEQEELVTERFTEFVDQEGNRRRVIVYGDESGEEKRVVLFKGPRVQLPDIGCYDSRHQNFASR